MVARSLFDGRGGVRGPDSAVVVHTAATDASTSTAADRAEHGLTLGGGIGDLRSDELETLLGALETVEAAPSAEPDEAMAGTQVARDGVK